MLSDRAMLGDTTVVIIIKILIILANLHLNNRINNKISNVRKQNSSCQHFRILTTDII